MRGMMMVPITVGLALATAGCAGADAPDVDEVTDVVDETEVDMDDAPATDDSPAGAPEGWDGNEGTVPQWVLDEYPDCDAVEPHVEPYVEGLEVVDGGDVGAYGVWCSWELPEDADVNNLGEIRSVEVSLESGNPEVIEEEYLVDLFDIITDDSLERADGIAYTTTAESSVAGVIVTTVEIPYVEVSITGGQWGDHPSLDGAAALEVAKDLLGVH
ncbi:hypothetical protein [Microbacterium karelineae]|uniref:hypothetical protein n=1 Tax=Microbacterium karelineae TaxID=2654283 RepID=UPI0012EAE2F5|nr:hypothetical protein [Microbacterium karelineae]